MEFDEKLEMLEKRVDRLERFAGVCMGQIIDLMETVFILVETMPDYDTFPDEPMEDESHSVRQGMPEEDDSEEILSKEQEEELDFGYGEGFLDVEYAAEYLAGEHEEEPDGRPSSREKEALMENGSRTEIGNPMEEEEAKEQEAKQQPAVPVNPIL